MGNRQERNARAINWFLKILFIPLVFFSSVQCNVIWTSPKRYHPDPLTLQPPIMSLDEYTSSGLINTHARPYLYGVEKNNGAVLVFGAEHTNDPDDNQFQLMQKQWKEFRPTIAMVEGRLGFLFSWMQDPVEELGEGGFTAKMARSDGIELYSWEPGREAEVEFLLGEYDAALVASFFCLRPYLNRHADLTKEEQDQIMSNFIAERTTHPAIKGSLTSLSQLDSIWNKVNPEGENWRTYQHPQNGWPKGPLNDMFGATNLFRDIHMCRSIIELVNRGERVFISMGSSHAPRIEKTLKAMLK